MQYTLEELQHKLYQKVYEVYDIFKDFFGEEYVDLQKVMDMDALRDYLRIYVGAVEEDVYELSEPQYNIIKNQINTVSRYPHILVWWPNVRVTNEFDRHVDIQDLYAKIQLTLDGSIPYENHGFQLTRSTFSTVQYSSGYIHSHIQRFRDTPEFSNPCYGRGPIKETINTLKVSQDEASWLLFCQELSLYVTVESIAGIPYFRMENIGESSIIDNCTGNLNPPPRELLHSLDHIIEVVPDFESKIRHFIKYYLEQGTLKLCFINGEYRCGQSYYDFIISISNAFISWFNSHGDTELLHLLYYNKIIYPCQIKEGKVYSAQSEDYVNIINFNRVLSTFKDHDVTLRVISNNIGEESVSTILDIAFARYILGKIIQIINYKHAKSINQQSGYVQSTPTYKNVIYL